MEAALLDQNPESSVRSTGSWVVMGPGAEHGEASTGDAADRRTAAMASFMDGDSLASLWISDSRLRQFLAYGLLEDVREALLKTRAESRAFSAMNGVAWSYGEAQQYRGHPSEYEDHVFSLKGPTGERLETTHTHTKWGRKVAELLSAGDHVDVPTLQVPGSGSTWLDWTMALDTAALKRVYDLWLQPIKVQQLDPLTCLVDLVPLTLSPNVSLLHCLSTWNAMNGATPKAVRVVSWREEGRGPASAYALLLLFEGGEAEAKALLGQINSSHVHVKAEMVDDARFALLFSTDPKVEVGEVESQKEARSRLDIDLTSIPEWVAPEVAADFRRVGAVYEVTPEATFTALGIAGQFPTELDITAIGAEPVEGDAILVCHEDLHSALGLFPELTHRLPKTTPENRGRIADEYLERILQEANAATDACIRAHPASAARYQRLLSVVYWMAGILTASHKHEKEASVLFEKACDLGEPLACEEPITRWTEEAEKPAAPAD